MEGLSKPQMLALWLADLSKIKLNSREQWSSSGGRRGHANVIPTSQMLHLLTLPPPAPFGVEGIVDLLFIFYFQPAFPICLPSGVLESDSCCSHFPRREKTR